MKLKPKPNLEYESKNSIWEQFQQKKKKKQLEQPVNERGFPAPLKVKCFKKDCQKIFGIKYVVPNKSYSKVNNWEYWVNPKSKDSEFWKDKESRKKDRYICSSCLLKFYYDKETYWNTITDLKTRGKLKTYIFNKTISS